MGVSGYPTGNPDNEIYDADRGDDLNDFGFQDWIEYTLRSYLSETLATASIYSPKFFEK